jgi:hypothetical protein
MHIKLWVVMLLGAVLLGGCRVNHEVKGLVKDNTVRCPPVVLLADGERTSEGALTLQGRQNLEAFARLYGYIRFFHPSNEAVTADWDLILWNGVMLVESVSDAPTLAARLTSLFCPVAPTVQIYPLAAPPTPLVLTPPASTAGIQWWRHEGAGAVITDLGEEALTFSLPSLYSSRRGRATIRGTAVPSDFPNPNEPFTTEIGAGLAVRVPLAVFDKGTITLPPVEPGKLKPLPLTTFTPSFDDRTTRLGEIILYWNFIQHFNPYLSLSPDNWEDALSEALEAAAVNRDGYDYWMTLRRLTHHLHDGHADIILAPADIMEAQRYIPVIFEAADNQIVVRRVLDEASVLRPGDVILSWNGEAMATTVQRYGELVSSGTESGRIAKVLTTLAAGRAVEPVILEYQRGTDLPQRTTLFYSVPWHEYLPNANQYHPDWDPIAEVAPGIYYFSLSRITLEMIVADQTRLEGAQAVIVDLREVPPPDWTSGPGFLTPAEHQNPSYTTPIFRHPNQIDTQIDPLPPSVARLDSLDTRFVYLVNGRTQSVLEHWAVAGQGMGEGQLVGSQTSGSNGNVNQIPLPSGFSLFYTQQWATKPDGRLFYGEGVVPNHLITPTIADIAAGHDTLLEYAITLIQAP